MSGVAPVNSLSRRSFGRGFTSRILAMLMIAAVNVQLASPYAQAAPNSSPSHSSTPLNLDLTSTTRTLATPGKLGTQTVIINDGATRRVVTSQSMLTPGERLAVWQVLSTPTHQQLIQLGAGGNAVGGSFTVGSWLSNSISNLVIPKGVTSIDTAVYFNLSGNLTNSGTLNVQPIQATAATVNAANILNNLGASITSLVPLTLAATGTIANSGSIQSAGSLTMSAGGSIVNGLPAGVTGATPSMTATQNVNLISNNIVNSGLIAAQNGSINIAAQGPGSINVTNTGGSLSALNGNINVRDLSYTGSDDSNLIGGDLLSQNLNIWSGSGTANVYANNISGVVNIKAGAAHVAADNSSLYLGRLDVSGDPTYFNTGGDIDITQSIALTGVPLALIASGNVVIPASATNVSISGSPSFNAGSSVLIMAGANFTVSPPSASGSNDMTSVVSIIGGSTAGGSIQLQNLSGPLDAHAAGGAAGNVTLVAFGGNAIGSGTVNLQSGINTYSSGGPAGNVVIMAGATSNPANGAAITIGPIQTSTSTSNPSPSLAGQGGEVLLVTGSGVTVSGNLFIQNGGIPTASPVNNLPSPTNKTLVVNNATLGLSGYQTGQYVLVQGNVGTVAESEQDLITNISPGASTTTITLQSVTNSFTSNVTLYPVPTITSSTITPASISVGSIYTNGSAVMLAAGANVSLLGPITTNGGPSHGGTGPGGSVAIFAGGSITGGTTSIDTHALTSSQSFGGDVFLAAGANLQGSVSDTFRPNNNEGITSSVTVTGASTSDGNISLPNLSAINTIGSASNGALGYSGGNVSLIAFAGSPLPTTTGMVNLPNTSMTTGGSIAIVGSGYTTPNANGNVTLLAGASTGNSISVGNIDTTGGSISAGNLGNGGAGNITIVTAEATSGLPFTYGLSNQYSGSGPTPISAVPPFETTSGSFSPGPVLAGASATVGNLLAVGGNTTQVAQTGGTPQNFTTNIFVQTGNALSVGSVSNLNNGLPSTSTVTQQPPAGSQISSSTITLIAGGIMTFSGATPTITSSAIPDASLHLSNLGRNGGSIVLSAQSFAITATDTSKTIAITADGTGGTHGGVYPSFGNGGSISITTTGSTSAASINIGTNNPSSPPHSYFTISAQGDAQGGNGGSLNVTSGADISVYPYNSTGPVFYLNVTPYENNQSNPGNLGAVPTTGTGGTIILTASNPDPGNCASGCVYINSTLDASGAAATVANPTSGNGGLISITVNSSATFKIGNGTNNGVGANAGPYSCSGCLTANGNLGGSSASFGSGGSISVVNLGGAITVQATGSNPHVSSATGSIEVQASDATTSSPGGNGGSIILQAATTVISRGGLDASGGAASSTLPYGNAGSIEIDTNSANQFVVQGTSTTLPNGQQGVQGTLTALGNLGENNITTAPTAFILTTGFGSGGSITLSNAGAGGIKIAATGGSAAIAVSAADANPILNLAGGEGGTIRLYAPAGPVEVDASLDVSGGAPSINTSTVPFPSTPIGSSGQFTEYGFLNTTPSFFSVTNANGFQANQLVTVIGPFQSSPSAQPVNVAAIPIISSVQGSTVNFPSLTGLGNTFNQYLQSGPPTGSVTMSAYYFPGNAGTIDIRANSSASAFTVNSGTTSNGVNGTLTANGLSGGTIIVTNLGTKGVQVAANSLSAQPIFMNGQTNNSFNPNPKISGQVFNFPSAIFTHGGNGGNVSLQAPAGAVLVNDTIDAGGESTNVASSLANLTVGPNYGGNGGTIFIGTNTTNVSPTPFTIGGTIGTNGVLGLLAAGGLANAANGNGGSINVVNLGTDGITANTTLTVKSPDSTGSGNTPGNGGSISLQTNGPVSITGQLIADGGAASGSLSFGLAGSIYILCNNGSNQLTIAPVNVSGPFKPELTASGWNGGQITVINEGSAGILINNNTNGPAVAVTAQAANPQAVIQNLVTGGPGGSISLQAPNGPVLINGNLDASGGADCNGCGYSGTGILTYSANYPTPPKLPWSYANGDVVSVQLSTGTTQLQVNEWITITGTLLSGPTVSEVEQITNPNPPTVVSNPSTGLLYLGAFYSTLSQNNAPVTVTAYFPGGNGGQINIVSNSSSAFVIGSATSTNGITGTLSANGGGGANGGSIYVTNLANNGGISVASASNLTVTAGSAVSAGSTNLTSGGAGGSIYLNATGQGGTVYIGSALNANSGTATGTQTTGAGGTIAIAVNSPTTVFNLGGCNSCGNGVNGALSATGSSGGSIGIKQLGAAGITVSPSSIAVTASSGNGGNIDLEAPAGTLTLTGVALNADASASPGNGGTIVLNAQTITASGTSVSAQGTNGNGGTVVITQSSATAPTLVVSNSDNIFNINVDGGLTGGNILLTANALTIGPSGLGDALTQSITITLTGSGATALTGGSITANYLILNNGATPVGSQGTSLMTDVQNLSMAATTGAIYISNISSYLMINASSSQSSISVSSNSGIGVNGQISATGPINLTAAGASIDVNNNITSGSQLILTATGSGEIDTTNENGVSGLLASTCTSCSGVVLNAGSGGILNINTSTASLTLNALGGNVSVTNTGNLYLTVGGSIQNLSVTNNLGSITTNGFITAVNSVTLNNQTTRGIDSYSISLGGSVIASAANGSVDILAAGSIVQTAAIHSTYLVQANSIVLSSQNGNIGTDPPSGLNGSVCGTCPSGTFLNPFYIMVVGTTNAPGTLAINVLQNSNGTVSVVTPNAGQVSIVNVAGSGVNLNGVLTAGDFSLANNGGTLSVNSNAAVASRFGSVTLYNSPNAGNLIIGSNVTANGGPVLIEDDALGANISIGSSVAISGYGRVLDYQGTSPGLQWVTGVAIISETFSNFIPPTSLQTVPAGVTVNIGSQTYNSGAMNLPFTLPTAYFGPGLSATGATVNVASNPSSPYKTAVVLNGANSTSITLGSGATITSNGTIQAISSLDLAGGTTSNATNLQNLASNVPTAGVSYSGGTYTIQNTVSLLNLDAFNIPLGTTVKFQNFGVANPVTVNITANLNATIQTGGKVQFTSTTPTPSSQGIISFNSTSTTNNNVLSILSAGSLTSDDNLLISSGGNVNVAGKITAGATGNLGLSTGMANSQVSMISPVISPPGSVFLTGTFSAGTASGSGSLLIDSTGSIIQTAGTITASNVSLTIGGSNSNTFTTSQIQLNAINATQLQVTAASGTGTSQSNATVGINETANNSIQALNFNLQNSSIYMSQGSGLNVSGSALGTVNVNLGSAPNILIISGNLSCGSCILSTTGPLIGISANIAVTSPTGTFSLSTQPSLLQLIGSQITVPSGTLTLSTSGQITIRNTSITVGTLSPFSLYTGGLLLPTDIGAVGSINISSSYTGNQNAITTLGGTSMLAYGGNLQITATSGSMALEGQFQSAGGNVSILAAGNISGTGPSLTANAIGTMATNSSGGNIEMSAGSTTSQLSSALNFAPGTVVAIPTFLQPDNTVKPLGRYTSITNLLGTAVGTGVILQNGQTGASLLNTVNLSTSNGATTPPLLSIPATIGSFVGAVIMNGGSVVFDATGTSSIKFNGSTFSANSYSPISYRRKPSSPIEVIQQPGAEPEDADCRLANVFVAGREGVQALTSQGITDIEETTTHRHSATANTPLSLKLRSGTVFINPLSDATIHTPFGIVQARKGALLSVGIDSTGLRVIACSGPGHVRLIAGNHVTSLAPGEEAVITDYPLSSDQQIKADGVGRRAFHSYTLGAGLYATICEISLTGMLSQYEHMSPIRHPHNNVENSIANDLLRNAAALHIVTQGHGAYTSREKAGDSMDDSENLVPVDYIH